ncbi:MULTISPECIES: cytochrome P450 [Streptomyces]|uniref:Cytochrome P450 n=1 Tax=Streptomyces glycanivorans TaxID=3033808 RepID=A0ABY9JF89_9ACTN|nr:MULTISPECIES: cytochrome P450 [unclassified Streptomyces]WSQ79756.1 cytochrome P450 [Streptomyces sp. NBC_01213]TXS09080.1 cytochrome P450 [Streptomyces sp. wa22]WLQ66308.1 cytochrome P450 [Streptomyces sp. Alt3]WSQ87136.1 cytochrome P450 [Streptomyces sp. NBC_01212]WSR06848.1 cytochrome P450 [Streptomyces sp. NBC_01208]
MPQHPAPIVLDPAARDADAEHELLRAQGPAARIDILGVEAWSVSDPVLLKQLLTSPEVSKDGRRHWPGFDEAVRTWPLALWVAATNMFTAYGGDHRRLRRTVAPAFSARRVAAMRPTVEGIVEQLLDALEATPAGEVADLRDRLAYPLPIAVIGRLLGVPDDRATEFRSLVNDVFSTTLTPEEAASNAEQLYAMLDALIAAKRAAPGEDMASVLIALGEENADGQGLAEEELRDTLLLMINAGYETTVNLIDQAVTHLLTDPDQLAHVRAGRASWTDVVEETLRHSPPVKHLPLRFAVTDIALPDGRTIAKGEAILASYAAANRHPGWHRDPHAFDVTRITKEHLAFGHGIHFCLGAALARMEAEIALEAFFDRFPDAAIAPGEGDMGPVASLISNGHRALPVRLRPRRD